MPRFSTSSLQFRLTLELVSLAILGLGSVSIWAGWQMEQNLVSAHKQALEYIATYFPEQVTFYSEQGPIETGLTRTIDRVSAPGLIMWVKSPEGKILAKSPEIFKPESTIEQVTALPKVPDKPQIFHFGDRYIVLCGNPVTINGKFLGHIYLSKDITDDQQKFNTGIWRLLAVSGVTIGLLIVAISQRIRKAMNPIKQMSQIASSVSADDLTENLRNARLQLNRAPDEILGLAQAFNEMLSRLSGSWEQQRQFVGNVSHELRTPLTVVMGYLQSLLRRSHNLNTYQQQALETDRKSVV